MAKWSGNVGFRTTGETERKGIWEESVTEYPYYGDVLRNSRRLQTAGVIDDLNISNQISIVADPFARTNFHNIIYAEYMGSKWKVTDIEVEFPRLILTLGGEYNE